MIVILAASICLAVNLPEVTAFKPNSPKETAEPLSSVPFSRPLCLFLNFTRLGDNMALTLYSD
ncbi:hypothetical protein LEP1GSC052_2868 [Leptospira kmetyi serovar Malaysia str. Bejo-Iso9]|nr:hypothetical protein LEP1GSC052_2868 [Leptospira kmetyi serovar Malaysia str. Bejo-Iso9]